MVSTIADEQLLARLAADTFNEEASGERELTCQLLVTNMRASRKPVNPGWVPCLLTSPLYRGCMRSPYEHVERMRRALKEFVPKRHRAGTHRAVEPEETLARIKDVLPAAGITRVANVTGLDKIGIPVVMVCRPNARSLAVAQGKGATLAAAKVSGIMEALETYHGEHVYLPMVFGTYDELRKVLSLVDVSTLPAAVDTPFDVHRPMNWVAGYDLMQDEEVWLPFEIVHVNYTARMHALASGRFSMTSTGLASGNSLVEAVSHGICEVIERDALMLWRFGLRSTWVLPDGISDPVCRQLLSAYAAAEVSVHIWDLTSDIELPTYVCLIHDGGEQPLNPGSTAAGVGCHLSAPVALSRALTEAAQSRLTLIAGSRDDLPRAMYDPATAEAVRELLAQAGSDEAVPLRPSQDSETLGEDVERQLERLRKVGVRQVVAVDLTKAEFGIPVVRVVIPGLECGAFGHSVALPGKRAAGLRLRSSLDRAFASATRELPQ
jgi:ribosomal protein S12 methylthiotransferase accessory factor